MDVFIHDGYRKSSVFPLKFKLTRDETASATGVTRCDTAMRVEHGAGVPP